MDSVYSPWYVSSDRDTPVPGWYFANSAIARSHAEW